ncbi:tol-pal system protein YbgF [Notoacmeibacter sp. MSK16QG-6]|uniref:tol-pal system protein YbgF n=1 Tax=Notoacmeibacter sp. MSK16QG-6 TaxID=2957982 RepID=UPI00209F40BD|nr:tol-pal system protein YbgF [Notoacmeibacter sp. MSK16QG-6]MCP1200113.1 tol-pal system protein YbgF [Notoacmeibacter sp. MSK16QG-6]
MALAKTALLRAMLMTVAVCLPLGAAGAGPLSIFKRDEVKEQAPVQMVQAADPRVAQLEEQVRRLNGTIEDLNFQILQLQEQVRKQLEDMQFRIDQLEGNPSTQGDGQSGAIDNSATEKAEVEPASPPATLTPAEEAKAHLSEEIPMDAMEHSPHDNAADGSSAELGAPPRDLGNLTLDNLGNVEATMNDTVQTDGTTVASLPAEATPSAVYSEAYQRVLAGDYAGAESGFRRFGEQYPDDPQAADAQFWLGESLRGQERYADAVEVFLDGTKTYSDSDKAPDMMLKLGVTLAAMGQKDVACETLSAIPARYPQTSDAFRLRLEQEEASASC